MKKRSDNLKSKSFLLQQLKFDFHAENIRSCIFSCLQIVCKKSNRFFVKNKYHLSLIKCHRVLISPEIDLRREHLFKAMLIPKLTEKAIMIFKKQQVF